MATSQDRCRLCQFKLEDDEETVATSDQIPIEIAFFGNKHIENACFHRDCYNFHPSQVSEKLLAATYYAFRPPILEERRRTTRIVQILSERLKVSWLKIFPGELCQIVARYLVKECAVVTAQALVSEPSAGNRILYLSEDVYARFIIIDGIRYIQSLRNASRLNTEPGEELLLACNTPYRSVYIGEDHLGIRYVQFSKSASQNGRTGVWWRRLAQSAYFETITDGSKLRDLVSSEKQITTRWSRINPSPTMLDLSTLHRPQKIPRYLRMSSFECNSPGVTGYSIATDGLNTATIHAHTEKSDLSCYQEIDSFFGASMVWIYVPIDKGEYVTRICRRLGVTHTRSKSLALIFITNRDRCTLFGCHMPPPTSKGLPLDHFHTPPTTLSRIYYNEWDSTPDNTINFLGFEHAGPMQYPVQPFPKSLIPLSALPDTSYHEIWFYSVCSMKEVVEITVCVNKTLGHRPIIGMLLRYGTEHRACVGQFRLDWALEPIIVDRARKLYIGIAEVEKGCPYVAYVDFGGLKSRNCFSCLEVSWTGSLESVFSALRTQLSYHGT